MPSEFGELLAELVGFIPGAVGAVFLDWEGEAVDQFGHIPELDIRLQGAHWGVVLNLVTNVLGKDRFGNTQWIILGGEIVDVLIHAVTTDYFIVLIMRHGSHLAKALKELKRVTSAMLQEM